MILATQIIALALCSIYTKGTKVRLPVPFSILFQCFRIIDHIHVMRQRSAKPRLISVLISSLTVEQDNPPKGVALSGVTTTVCGECLPVLVSSAPDEKLVFYWCKKAVSRTIYRHHPACILSLGLVSRKTH